MIDLNKDIDYLQLNGEEEIGFIEHVAYKKGLVLEQEYNEYLNEEIWVLVKPELVKQRMLNRAVFWEARL